MSNFKSPVSYRIKLNVCILNDVFPAWTRWSFITLRVCVYTERRVSSMNSLIIHYVTSVCVYWTTCFQYGLVDHSLRYDCVCILNDVFPVWTRWSFITLRLCVYIERRVSSMDSLIIHYVTIVNILWVMRVLFSLNTTLKQISYCEIVLDRNRKHTVVKKIHWMVQLFWKFIRHSLEHRCI